MIFIIHVYATYYPRGARLQRGRGGITNFNSLFHSFWNSLQLIILNKCKVISLVLSEIITCLQNGRELQENSSWSIKKKNVIVEHALYMYYAYLLLLQSSQTTFSYFYISWVKSASRPFLWTFFPFNFSNVFDY